MSEAMPYDASVSHKSKVKIQAAIWLARATAGNWSDADQKQLDMWLAESYANRATYWRLEAAWAEAAKLAVLRPLARENDVAARHFLPMIMKMVAAVIVVGTLGAVGATRFWAFGVQGFATGIGGHKVLTLADGSKIELNTDTALRIADKGGARKIWLDKGEAFFQVRHSVAHSFVVTVGNHNVVDLGTKFAIRRDAGQVEVSLVEGRAEFEQTGRSSPSRVVLLNPGDVLVATANSTTVTKKPAQELNDTLAWRRGALIFFHTTLAEAAEELNRYNVQKIVIADADAAHLQINGTFPSNNSHLFGHVAHVVLGVNVENNGDEIVISR
jgi:transmembrane sensor